MPALIWANALPFKIDVTTGLAGSQVTAPIASPGVCFNMRVVLVIDASSKVVYWVFQVNFLPLV